MIYDYMQKVNMNKGETTTFSGKPGQAKENVEKLNPAETQQLQQEMYDSMYSNKIKQTVPNSSMGHEVDNSNRIRHLKEISADTVKTTATKTEGERIAAYQNCYRTNIAWGGGSKEHPGHKRVDPLSVRGSVEQLSRTHGDTFGVKSR